MHGARLILVTLLALACCGSILAGGGKSITLVSPNSGLNLNAGQSAFIHWTYTGYAENTMVRIVLFQNGNKLGEITTPQPIQNPAQSKGHGGTFWTVGAYAGKTAAPGCGFKVNVRVQDATEEHELSSVPFCITGQGQSGSLTVAAPNGGEKWTLDSQREIRWTSSGLTGNVKIRLRKSDWSMERTIANSVPLAAGKFTWKVGDLLDPHPDLTEACGGLTVVVQTLDGKHRDESNGAFSVDKTKELVSDFKKSGNWIKVSSPKAGSTWVFPAVCNVAWTFSDTLHGKKAKLLLLKPDNGVQMVIETKMPLNIDDYNWNLPGASFVPAGSYRLRVQANDLPTVYGDSELFRVEVADVELTSPKSGDTFIKGDDAVIAWTMSDYLKGKKGTINLLNADGKVQKPIAPHFLLTGKKYSWTIPNDNSVPAGTYKVRLTADENESAWDDSGWFRIRSKPVKTIVKYAFSPAITNKCYMKHSRDEGAFIIDPNSLEYPDPGNCCCRIGWNHRCDDGQKTRYIYRSHLGLDLRKIAKSTKVVSARLTWQESGTNPTPIFLHKLTSPWNGDAAALFSVPCVQVNPNDAAQMMALAQEWVNNPDAVYGFLFTGSDESFSCSSAKTSIHILSQVVFHVETEELKTPD